MLSNNQIGTIHSIVAYDSLGNVYLMDVGSYQVTIEAGLNYPSTRFVFDAVLDEARKSGCIICEHVPPAADGKFLYGVCQQHVEDLREFVNRDRQAEMNELYRDVREALG